MADLRSFLIMIWAARTLQSGGARYAGRYIDYPNEAVTEDLASPYFFHPWRLETLANERLRAAAVRLPGRLRSRSLNCTRFDVIASLMSNIASIENAYDGIVLESVHILREMHRLIQRQLEWQGFQATLSTLYRSAYIYGGEKARAHFAESYGISIEKFTKGTFAIASTFKKQPIIPLNFNLSAIGINQGDFELILSRIALSEQSARELARQLRSAEAHLAYSPSVLRKYPCIRLGPEGNEVCAPLQSLVFQRATEGIFYDMLNSEPNVKKEIAERFEIYCKELLSMMLPSYRIDGEMEYVFKKNRVLSPDIAISNGDGIRIIVECKATRMPFEAKFSSFPEDDARRSYEEIAKGVYQIWKYVAHRRLGFAPGGQLQDGVIGIVLTLDTWLTMSHAIRPKIFEMADKMCSSHPIEILSEDRIGVIFSPVEVVIRTLMYGTEESFFAAASASTTARYEDWMLQLVHKDLGLTSKSAKEYPFLDRLGEVIDWWDEYYTEDIGSI